MTPRAQKPPSFFAGMFKDDRWRIRTRIRAYWRISPRDRLAKCLPQAVDIRNFDHGNGLNIAVWTPRYATAGRNKDLPFSQIEVKKHWSLPD